MDRGQVRRRSLWMQRRAVRSGTASGCREAARRTQRSIIPGSGIERAGRKDQRFSVRGRRLPGAGARGAGHIFGASRSGRQCNRGADMGQRRVRELRVVCAKRAAPARCQPLSGAGAGAGSMPRERTRHGAGRAEALDRACRGGLERGPDRSGGALLRCARNSRQFAQGGPGQPISIYHGIQGVSPCAGRLEFTSRLVDPAPGQG